MLKFTYTKATLKMCFSCKISQRTLQIYAEYALATQRTFTFFLLLFTMPELIATDLYTYTYIRIKIYVSLPHTQPLQVLCTDKRSSRKTHLTEVACCKRRKIRIQQRRQWKNAHINDMWQHYFSTSSCLIARITHEKFNTEFFSAKHMQVQA